MPGDLVKIFFLEMEETSLSLQLQVVHLWPFIMAWTSVVNHWRIGGEIEDSWSVLT